jgi:predicted transcriptional regulator
MAGAHRVLNIVVAPESGDRSMITLAHELQHAIEVLEADDVTTETAVDRLFERIGARVGASIMETRSAVDVQRVVARELSRNRR